MARRPAVQVPGAGCRVPGAGYWLVVHADWACWWWTV